MKSMSLELYNRLCDIIELVNNILRKEGLK